ncbi:proline racemase [Dethiosulfatibacter aminovorans DSM 17477]|uniref:Proline racemase n=1 Tax=Dethiosulfatibacter aminovorans DSM 17477 TaxID=1121476 RepID=A0A1M6MQI4_9FIRM|nr:proline racemase family protein [Dethiosulfatibacter aminovorans]SHJ85704.1 proline racemase [Dethiosulfatibacter aminovorans DSM 17477]
MKTQKTLFTVESHTMGQPLRCVVGGIHNIIGETMMKKKESFINNYDDIRKSLMLEPRGHRDMFGAVITKPTMAEADYGVIFMHGQGYHNMCGHGTIAVSTIAIETGMVEACEPETIIRQEAPAGLVTIKAKVKEGRAEKISFENVPAFLYRENVLISVPDHGDVKIDVAFGGSFFAVVDHEQLNIDICPENASQLVEIGMAIIEAANEQIDVVHPELPDINTIDLCEIYGPAKSEDADMQNVTIFDGQIDRSPCGTGTCAKMATLYAKGKLGINEEFTYESIINTKFVGRVLCETKVGSYVAVVPEITGSAFITGNSKFIIDPDDPVKYGFSLS